MLLLHSEQQVAYLCSQVRSSDLSFAFGLAMIALAASLAALFGEHADII